MGNGFTESQPIQVFLGNGDGTFQPVRRFWNLTGIPDKSVAGDFNHDGKLDLAVTVLSNDVAVLLGNGDGSFAAPVIYPTDELPSGLAVADLNRDGVLDLIATGLKVDVFLGKGDGTFPNRVDYTVQGFPDQLTTGDFDGDGKLDIAVTANASGPGFLEILFGNGDGTFQDPFVATDDAPLGAPGLVGDFNSDGIDDLFVASENGSLFLSAPLATVSPSSLNFGSVVSGAISDSMAIAVTNSGNSPLHVTGATVASSFSVVGSVCGTALARLENCTIPVAFSPTALGTQSGQVLIQEDAYNSKPVVLLTGTGVSPTLVVNPAAIDFGSQDMGTSSAAQTITLTNTSNGPMTISLISATGPFAVTSQCGATLGSSANCTVSIVFTPQGVGQQSGSITITDDAAGSPQSVSLTGTGAAVLTVAQQAGGSTSATVKSGQAATYNLALTAGPTFSGTVSLTCSGAPANANCSISPSSVVLSAGGTQNFMVTVTTSQQVAMGLMHDSGVQLAGLGFASCTVLLTFAGRVRRVRLVQFLLLLALTTAAPWMVVGCGGGSSAPTKPSSATVTPGTYQLTITATSGSASSTQTLTLVVQ